MLLLKAGFLLLLCVSVYSAAVNLPTVQEYVFKCPDHAKELLAPGSNDCHCYEAIAVLHCKQLTVRFKLEKVYKFKSIVIEKSPNMPFPLEHLRDIAPESSLTTESLVILNEKSELKFPFTDNLNDFLEASTKSIKIVGNGKQTLDIGKMKPSVESIVIENIALISENYENVTEIELFARESLKHLVIKNSQFKNPRPATVLKGPLERIEFVNTNINGVFGFERTTDCEAGETIHIDLNGNNNLDGIYFEKMFQKANCLFHITISKSAKLTNLFEQKGVAAALTNNIGKFYLQLRNQDIACGCEIYNLYNYIAKKPTSDPEKKMSDYIHSVYCKTQTSGLFLDDLIDDTADKNKICEKGKITNHKTTL